MSVDMLILISMEPTYRPEPVLTEQAKVLLKKFIPQAEEILVQITEEIEFIATGGNLERIVCPFCHSMLDEQWWIAAMDAAYDRTRFVDLTIQLPCCGAESSLNNLQYELPTGFASFQLIVRNPGNDIGKEAIHVLEQILSCTLKKIWAHF